MMWRAVAGAIHSLTLILLTIHRVTYLVNNVEGGGGGDPLPGVDTSVYPDHRLVFIWGTDLSLKYQ